MIQCSFFHCFLLSFGMCIHLVVYYEEESMVWKRPDVNIFCFFLLQLVNTMCRITRSIENRRHVQQTKERKQFSKKCFSCFYQFRWLYPKCLWIVYSVAEVFWLKEENREKCKQSKTGIISVSFSLDLANSVRRMECEPLASYRWNSW